MSGAYAAVAATALLFVLLATGGLGSVLQLLSVPTHIAGKGDGWAYLALTLGPLSSRSLFLWHCNQPGAHWRAAVQYAQQQ